MKKISKEFKIAISLLSLALVFCSAVLVNKVNRETTVDEGFVLGNAKIQIASLVNTLLVNSAEEKYTNELFLNLGGNDHFLKKAVSETRLKRSVLVKKLNALFSVYSNNREIILFKNSINQLNSKFDKLMEDSDNFMETANPDFKIKEWSNSLSAVLDEIEKVANLASGSSGEQGIIANNMAVTILNCYKQIFLISMYSYKEQKMDGPGQMIFFTYERDLMNAWQKLQALLWFKETKNWFISNFQHKYFDSFVEFKNSFLGEKHPDTSKLFKEFNLIVRNYDKFFEEVCTGQYQSLTVDDMMITQNVTLFLAILLLFFTLLFVVFAIRKNSEIFASKKEGLDFDDDLAKISLSDKAMKNLSLEFVPLIFNSVRQMSIDNHKDLNSTYNRISDSINKVKEKINAISYQDVKLKEAINSLTAKCSNSEIERSFTINQSAAVTLKEINSNIGKFSYSALEDTVNGILDSSNKVDAINAAMSEISKKIELFSAEIFAAESNGRSFDDSLAKNFQKLSGLIIKKIECINQWGGAIKSDNDSIAKVIRDINTSMADTKSKINHLLDLLNSFKKEFNRADGIEIKKNSRMIEKSVKDHEYTSQGSIDIINQNLKLCKDYTIHLINSMSSFKDDILSKISSYEEVPDDSEAPIINSIPESMYMGDVKNRFYGAEDPEDNPKVVDIISKKIKPSIVEGNVEM